MNRRQATAHRRIVKADEAVMTVVAATPGINKTKLRSTVRNDHGLGRNEDIDQAVERLVENGHLIRVKAGNTHLHYPGQGTTTTYLPNMPNVPDNPTGTTGVNVPAPLKGAHTQATPHDHQPTCPHGMPNGQNPDPFVNGRQACPQCAQETP